ncbi:MAG: DUF47 family protein [Candidatus Kariarchaeaceae archaeon]|jgi:predicted phosphate transport protein (TIGR00153 family)
MDQKEQKEKFIELSKLIREAGKLYADCIYDPSVSEENTNKILELESKGDKIQAELDDHFRTQKNIPYLALDRAKLVRKLDSTLDQIKLAGMTFNTFGPSLPRELIKECESLAKLTMDVTDLLASAVEIIYTSFKEALDLTRQIEELRDQVMVSAFSLENQFFDTADASTGWKEYTAISRIIKRTLVCVVASKEASEVLDLMAYKYD